MSFSRFDDSQLQYSIEKFEGYYFQQWAQSIKVIVGKNKMRYWTRKMKNPT